MIVAVIAGIFILLSLVMFSCMKVASDADDWSEEYLNLKKEGDCNE